MRSAILGFVLGVAVLQQQAVLFDLNYFLISCVALFFLAGIYLWYKAQLRLGFLISNTAFVNIAIHMLFAMCLGFCWAGLQAHFQLRHELPAEWEARDVEIIGVIDSLPSRHEQGSRFNFAVEKYLLPTSVDSASAGLTEKFPKRLALAWFDDADNIIDTPVLKPGQRWQLTVRLKRPHGNANPNGFDYEVWLLEQGVRATGSVRVKSSKSVVANNHRLNEFVWSPRYLIEHARFALRERIFQTMPDAAYKGVLSALVVGDQRDISPADWSMFNRTGIGHLISISGLHITMIAGMIGGLMHFLWRHSFFTRAQLPLLIAAPKVAVLAGLFAAMIYVALAGFGVPAQRTLWMLMVLALAIWRGRSASSTHVLSLALGLVVLIDPWAVLWPGFWLSFAAVGVLMYAGAGRIEFQQETSTSKSILQKLRPQLFMAARAQYAITVGLVPLTLLLFAQVSVVSPLANALAIPLVSFIVTPLALIGSVLPAPLAGFCLHIAHACIEGLVQFLEILSLSSIATWQTPKPTWWMFVLATLGLFYMLAPRGISMRWLGGVCCFPLLLHPAQRPEQDHMQVTVFDVGQGSAVLVETATHRLLYDTGPGFSVDTNSGTRILLPYLQARGISHLDQLMVSHSDNDHSGGAVSILKNVRVDLLSSSLPMEHPIVQQAKNAQRCVYGQQWEWDGVRFEILHPVPVIYTSDKWKPNALSCTLKISTRTHSLLLAGDIEAIQEDQLLNRIPQKLAADVLLAPHHGSGTSSTPAFLQAVNPTLALFQVGYLNRYHHPKQQVIQRYLDFGIKPLRTDTSGAITLQFGSAISVSEYRKEHARYWYK